MGEFASMDNVSVNLDSRAMCVRPRNALVIVHIRVNVSSRRKPETHFVSVTKIFPERTVVYVRAQLHVTMPVCVRKGSVCVMPGTLASSVSFLSIRPLRAHFERSPLHLRRISVLS